MLLGSEGHLDELSKKNTMFNGRFAYLERMLSKQFVYYASQDYKKDGKTLNVTNNQ